MKNNPDTAFILAMLCFILATLTKTEFDQEMINIAGGLWAAIGVVRLFLPK